MVEDERSSLLFALKTLSKQASRERLSMRSLEADFKREAALLRGMNHPHVIKLVHSA